MCAVYIVVLYVYILFILHRGLKKGKGERERGKGMLYRLKDDREFKVKNKNVIIVLFISEFVTQLSEYDVYLCYLYVTYFGN